MFQFAAAAQTLPASIPINLAYAQLVHIRTGQISISTAMCKWPSVATANPMITIPLLISTAPGAFFVFDFEKESQKSKPPSPQVGNSSNCGLDALPEEQPIMSVLRLSGSTVLSGERSQNFRSFPEKNCTQSQCPCS